MPGDLFRRYYQSLPFWHQGHKKVRAILKRWDLPQHCPVNKYPLLFPCRYPGYNKLKLLHDRHEDASIAVSQLRKQVLAAGGDVAVLRVRAEELAADLVLKLVAIHHDNDRRLAERGVKPHLHRGEEHGEALA